MTATSGAAIITTAAGTFGDTLLAVLPVVLGLAAVLIGVFFGWRQLKKAGGRGK